MKKICRIGFKVFLLICMLFSLCVLGATIFFLSYKIVPLDIDKITKTSLKIDVYNTQGLEIKEDNSFNVETIKLSQLPKNVKDAFISIEDKNFYSHKGVSLTRMSKAFLNNIKNFQFKEGASTITQQLIKNTHLTNEKKLPRKINEIRLALELERKMTKDEILENYLNVIYFGNNCYGIENASQYYFSKSANSLTLPESAMLAGMIKSPNYYSPTRNPQKTLQRRNLVIKEMAKDEKISQKECFDNINLPIELNINSYSHNKLNSYSQSAIDEACEILNVPERQIATGGYKIYTYQDLDKQLKLNNLVENTQIDSDYAVIDIDSTTCGVNAFVGKSDYKILDYTRQIGSIAKPIFVYAPAFNENILSPASLILDEPLTIGNYSPQNVSGKYLGYVDTRTCLSKSLNIPAVKTASYVGINKIASYAEKLNLPLDENDLSYSLALGGLTYGFNLKDICGAYSVFTNNGEVKKPKFVKYITNQKGDIVYKNNEEGTKVFRDDTSYLITDILKTCAKSGTARKLSDLPFEIASKTGTVGNKSGNTDAYNISFTTEDIVGVWYGNMNNKKISTAGGNQPTALAKEYYKKIYSTHKPQNFIMPSSVEKVKINQFELDNNHILLRANDYTPEKDTTEEIFSRFNMPSLPTLSKVLQPVNLIGYVENGKSVIKFMANSQNSYKLFREIDNKKVAIKEIANQNGQIEFSEDLLPNKKYSYFVEYATKNKPSQKNISNTITLINVNSDIPKAKWYL